MVKDKRVDAYITKSPEFAQPILVEIRRRFHSACPKIEEAIKWGFPFFEYKGIVGGMAGFKKNVTWGLWKAKMLGDMPRKLIGRDAPMMKAGKFSDVSQLPPKAGMIKLIKAAVALNENEVKLPPKKRIAKPLPKMPADFAAALKKNSKAAETFENFSPSHQREYLEWILGAKQAETRQRRLKQAVEMLSQGKSHNWKYEKR